MRNTSIILDQPSFNALRTVLLMTAKRQCQPKTYLMWRNTSSYCVGFIDTELNKVEKFPVKVKEIQRFEDKGEAYACLTATGCTYTTQYGANWIIEPVFKRSK